MIDNASAETKEKKKYTYLYREQGVYLGVKYDVKSNDAVEFGMKLEKEFERIRNGDKRTVPTMTVKKWGETYLETYRKPHCETQQYIRLLATMKVINDAIGTMPVNTVQKNNCQDILNDSYYQGYSKSHIIKVRNLLKALFEEAQESSLIKNNPARKLTMPNVVDNEGRALFPHERRIFEILFEKHPRGIWAEYIMMTGSRPGETFRAYGRHIEIDKGRIFIDGISKGRQSKRDRSKRYVPIRPDISPRLMAFFEERAKEPFLPIFTRQDGVSPLYNAVKESWWQSLRVEYEKILNKNIPEDLHQPFPKDLVPYCLRHTYGTDLKDMGVPQMIIAEYMGHKPDVTPRYMHETDSSFALGKSIIDKAVKKKRQNNAIIPQKFSYDFPKKGEKEGRKGKENPT